MLLRVIISTISDSQKRGRWLWLCHYGYLD